MRDNSLSQAGQTKKAAQIYSVHLSLDEADEQGNLDSPALSQVLDTTNESALYGDSKEGRQQSRVRGQRQHKCQPRFTLVCRHLHFSFFCIDGADVVPTPQCIVDIWEGTQSGIPAFSIEPDGKIAIGDHSIYQQ